MDRAKASFPQVQYHEDPYEALREADAALVCTEWDIFRTLDWVRAGKLMSRKLVIDGRNLYSPAVMRELGFEYYSFGREALWRSGSTASGYLIQNQALCCRENSCLKYARVLFNPSSRFMLGSHLRMRFALLMSGQRRLGSSCGKRLKYNLRHIIRNVCGFVPRTPVW